jgi:hypothetical protein
LEKVAFGAFSDSGFVAADKRRDFCRLLRGNLTVASQVRWAFGLRCAIVYRAVNKAEPGARWRVR